MKPAKVIFSLEGGPSFRAFCERVGIREIRKARFKPPVLLYFHAQPVISTPRFSQITNLKQSRIGNAHPCKNRKDGPLSLGFDEYKEQFEAEAWATLYNRVGVVKRHVELAKVLTFPS